MKDKLKIKYQFETFKNIGNYEVSNLKATEPSAINFLSYRKQRVTIEDIEESNDILIDRLEKLKSETTNHHRLSMINSELENIRK